MAKVWDPHLLIAWGGTLGAPPLDVWTNTLKALVYEPDGITRSVLTVAEQDELLPLLDPILTEWVAPSVGTDTHSPTVTMTWIKANMIAATGKYMYPTTSVRDLDPGVVGTAVGNADWRQSIVVSLLTAKSRGKAHAGRFYPPVSPLTFENTKSPYITTVLAQAFANQPYQKIADINSITLASGKSLGIVITSPGETDVAVDPVSNSVISTEVDKVPDTQRRRTNRVPRVAVGNA
jgi:hypothetical protein